MKDLSKRNTKDLEIQLLLAEKIATKAHKGQVDKAGIDYINHPKTVANSLNKLEHKIVGWLHDVIEDTEITINKLISLGFYEDIIKSVNTITKKEGVLYEDYLEMIKKDEIARNVKIADLKHNMDLSRINKPTEKDFERLEKYKKAIEYLEN